MAQTGFTPIQLYNSPTVGVLPTAGNLVLGELALNTSDENLYFKNTGGLIKTVGANLVANLAGKNVLINGDMSISQVNGGAAVTPTSSAYVTDMWGTDLSQASKLTFQQVSTSLNSLGAPVAEKITTAVAFTPTSSDYFAIHQIIEGNNFDRFFYGSANAKAASLQFKANASVAGTYSGSIANAANTRSYVFTFVLAANIDTLVTIQNIPGDTSGTWVGASSAASIQLRFDLGSGSTFRSSTINAWQAGNIVGATGSVSLLATASATLAISEVQFELGPVCTAYERKLAITSLVECGYNQGSTGAVTITQQAKNQQFVSVLDFGADPTGATDSTAAWNAAGSAAQQVIIPAGGTYTISGIVNGLFINLGSTINGVRQYGIAADTLATTLQGSCAQLGSQWQSQYHANWNVVQTQIPYNPTEWQIYPNAANGIVTVTSGTNQVTRVSGTPFDPAWVGQPYFYYEGNGYKVLAVTDANHLTVQTTGGGVVSWGSTANGTYYYCTTSTMGTVNTNGVAVTLSSGQPFMSLTSGITINGVAYTILSFNSPSSVTLSASAGVQVGVSYAQRFSINNELSNIRLQGLNGSSEEDFVITMTPSGSYIQNSYAGSGKYRPMYIGTGENPVGTFNPFIAMYPAATIGNPGQMALAGQNGNQAVTINQNSNNVNYHLIQGGTTGLSPSIAARGTDTAVGLGFDIQAAAQFNFTSHSFGALEFVIYGVGGTSYLTVASSNTDTPILGSNGADANIDIKLQPKGAGNIWLGAYTAGTPTATGYLTVKDASGTVRKLLCL